MLCLIVSRFDLVVDLWTTCFEACLVNQPNKPQSRVADLLPGAPVLGQVDPAEPALADQLHQVVLPLDVHLHGGQVVRHWSLFGNS